MAKKIMFLVIVALFAVSVRAGDTVFFSIAHATELKQGRVIKITSLPCPLANVYWAGTIEVCFIPKSPNSDTITLRDTSYVLEMLSTNGSACMTQLKIDLVNLVGPFLQKKKGTPEVDVTADYLKYLKDYGWGWRLIRQRIK